MIGAIHTQWLVEGRVRFLSAAGQIDLQTLKAYDAETNHIYTASSRSIHVIADVRYVKALPPISECLKLSMLWHKNLDMVVTVGAMPQPTTRILFTALVRLARLKYQDLTTLEDAQRYLLGCDPSLPPLNTWLLSTSQVCSGK